MTDLPVPCKGAHCANSNKEQSCQRIATPGHIYCNPCRVANGGYNRYNPPRAQAQIFNY